ncbi:hypothetical protein F2Q68_00021049 [Brassica cretica]|uniref:Uncharacterized protein n=1 Tax=Brassica cretica TaxID=69181 RepID=A0A8S9G170_BRACR|nr:hypothetical protein F2Q68_00021049 [Brassica cretica]
MNPEPLSFLSSIMGYRSSPRRPFTDTVGVENGYDEKRESSDKSSRRIVTQRPNACSARSLRSDRVRAKAQSLHSDQTPIPLGRYVATELEQKLGTELEPELGRYGHTSHPKTWFERFFFVRIDGESVEESYLHLFRREWNFTRVNRILPPTPADLFAKRDLLRGRPFFWNSFTLERIRSAVELHRSRAVSRPLDVPYDVEPVIDVLPAQRQGTRSRKGKGVASENVLGNPPLPEWNPSFSPGERSGTSEVPLPSDFFADLPPGFTTHESLDEESRRKGMRVFNAALDGSFRESRISHFKAEEAERELFRFRKEVEE